MEVTEEMGSEQLFGANGWQPRIAMEDKKLKFLYLNARSISNKVSTLEATVEVFGPDVSGITETWLNGCIDNGEIALKGYEIFRADRSS